MMGWKWIPKSRELCIYSLGNQQVATPLRGTDRLTDMRLKTEIRLCDPASPLPLWPQMSCYRNLASVFFLTSVHAMLPRDIPFSMPHKPFWLSRPALTGLTRVQRHSSRIPPPLPFPSCGAVMVAMRATV